jgi:hypothetical protein
MSTTFRSMAWVRHSGAQTTELKVPKSARSQRENTPGVLAWGVLSFAIQLPPKEPSRRFSTVTGLPRSVPGPPLRRVDGRRESSLQPGLPGILVIRLEPATGNPAQDETQGSGYPLFRPAWRASQEPVNGGLTALGQINGATSRPVRQVSLIAVIAERLKGRANGGCWFPR